MWEGGSQLDTPFAEPIVVEGEETVANETLEVDDRLRKKFQSSMQLHDKGATSAADIPESSLPV